MPTRSHDNLAALQIAYATVAMQKPSKWKELLTTDPTFGSITCLQAAPWRERHACSPKSKQSGTSDYHHKFSYVPLREHLRHILFISCSHRLLVYDVRDVGAPILSGAVPRSVGDAGCLNVQLCECLVPFPAEPSSSHPPTDGASGSAAGGDHGAGPDRRNMKTWRKRQRASVAAHGSGGTAQGGPEGGPATQGAPRCAGRPHAVVALGHMTAACRGSGQLFTWSIALAPPLRGLLVREHGGGGKRLRRGAGTADAQQTSVSQTDAEDHDEEKGGVEALLSEMMADKPEPRVRVDPVLLPTLRIEAGAQPDKAERGGGAALSLPWTFSHAAAAVCFGPARVFGFPLRAHLHADAMALPDLAAAEICAATAPAVDRDEGRSDANAVSVKDGVDAGGSDGGEGVEGNEGSDDEDAEEAEDRKAPQRGRYSPADMIAMLEGGTDSLGAVFDWRGRRGGCQDASSGDQGPEDHDERAVSVDDVSADDLVAGARLLEKAWAVGDGVACFTELMRMLPGLHVLRGLITGSAVVQEFAWGTWAAGEWPERLEVHLWHPDVHVDTGEMRREVKLAGVPSRRGNFHGGPGRRKRIHTPVDTLLQVADDLQSWKVGCTTCTGQLRGWWGLWSSEPLSIARAVHWLGADERQLLGAQLDGSPSDRSRDSETPEAATVHSWPFEEVEMDEAAGAAPAVVAAAVSGLLPHIRGALSAADLWAAVLMLHARVTGGAELEAAEADIAQKVREDRGWRLNAGRQQAVLALPKGLPEHFCGHVCPQELGGAPMYLLEEPEPESGDEGAGGQASMDDTQARERVAKLLEGRAVEEYLLGGEVPQQLPGKVIAASSRVYAGLNKNTKVKRQREKADVLLECGLRQEPGDGGAGGIGAGTVLAWLVHGLRGMGDTCHLQLHCVSHPWWLDEASLLPGGHILRRMAIRQCGVAVSGESVADAEAQDEGSGTHRLPGCDLSHWVLLPAGSRSQSRRVSVHSRHQLQMGPGQVVAEGDGVLERLQELMSLW